MNWLDLTITGTFWIVGILLARARRVPLRRQALFTIIMWGAMTLGVLVQKRNILGLDELAESSILIILGVIIIIFTFFRKRFFTPQMLAGIAMLIMLLTFAVKGYVVTYSMYILVGVLLLCASILSFKKKKPPAE